MDQGPAKQDHECLVGSPPVVVAVVAAVVLLRAISSLLTPSALQSAFKYCVDEIDLTGESSVDAEWMAYLGGFRYLLYLKLADCHRITSSALWPIAGMIHLKELDLSRCFKVTDAGIRHLVTISTLEKLHLSETHVTAAGVALLASLSNLYVLDLRGLSVTDQALRSLQVLTKLQYLDLWGSKISDNGVSALQEFQKLSYLNLAWTSVSLLPNLAALESLNMSNCTINSVLKHRGDKPRLAELHIAGANLENEEEAFKHIEKRFLSYMDASKSSLSRFSLLSGLVGLEYLDLSSTGLGDESVEQIAKIRTNLRSLNLNNTRVSFAGVEELAGCVPHLENLSLSHTPVDDFAILYISMMPALKAIDFSHTSIKGIVLQIESDKIYGMFLD